MTPNKTTIDSADYDKGLPSIFNEKEMEDKFNENYQQCKNQPRHNQKKLPIHCYN